MRTAEIHTPKGVMEISFYEEDAPNTVENFVKLAREGFYDGLSFHRVIKDFVIQGGCPYSKDMNDPRVGTGGPGYQIKCELNGGNQFHDRGVLSMAHAGRDTGGSQFFICFVPCPHLDGNHTVFGEIEVTQNSSFKTLDAIKQDDEIIKIEILESI